MTKSLSGRRGRKQRKKLGLRKTKTTASYVLHVRFRCTICYFAFLTLSWQRSEMTYLEASGRQVHLAQIFNFTPKFSFICFF